MENRRHLRIRKLMDVTWTMPGEDLTGQGQIINISSSGLLLHIDNSFKPSDPCVLSIDPEITEEQLPFLNKKGKVVWFRKIPGINYRYQCGVEFLPNGSNQDLQTWIDNKKAALENTMSASILNNYVV